MAALPIRKMVGLDHTFIEAVVTLTLLKHISPNDPRPNPESKQQFTGTVEWAHVNDTYVMVGLNGGRTVEFSLRDTYAEVEKHRYLYDGSPTT